MDLSKLWEGAGDHDEGGGVENGQRRDKRQYTYKRRGITFSSTTKDNRTLRSMQVTERRKGSRQSMHSAGRVIDAADLATAVENDEDEDSLESSSTLKITNDIQIKSRIRRDKLNEYLEQKKKLEDLKRKMAKPAFKVGIVHHPVAPTSGADVAPNHFSTTLNTAKAVSRLDRDKSRSSNYKIRRTKSDLTGERSKAFVFSAKDITKDISTKLPSIVEDQNTNISLTEDESLKTKILARSVMKDYSMVTVTKVEEKLPDVETSDPDLTTITKDIHEDIHYAMSNTKQSEAVVDQLPDLHIQKNKENEESSKIIEPPSVQLDHLSLNASCSNKNPTGFSKSKEYFIWFVKKATSDKRSFAHTELYHWLLKMFTDADIYREGLVRKVFFNKLFDMAVSIPRMYGNAPVETELYKTDEEKDQARQNMFDSMDIRGTGVITFTEWYQFSIKHLFAKTAKFYLHPLLDASDKLQFMGFIKDALVPGSSESTELYRFLVEVFAEHDVDKDGFITIKEFPAMINEVLKIPKKVSLVHSVMKQEDDDVGSDQYQGAMFKSYSTQNRLSLDEWLKLTIRDVYMKL